MNRRQFIRWTGVAATAGLAGPRIAAAETTGPRAQRPPNIVLILADDLGYREIGCYGQEKIKTPNIDRLAREGMRFTRFYSGSPVCAPTRCCLMTGKHTGHAFVRSNREVGGWGPEEPEGQLPLPDKEVTVAELLKRRGYTTAAIGKWGLGGPGSEGHPCYQGFDLFYGYLCQRVAHNYYPTHLWRNHDVDIQDGNRYFPAHQRIKEPLPNEADYDRYRGGDYSPEEMAKEAEKFIRDNRDRPFFLYYPTTLPHVALQAPQEYVDRYPREWDPKPYLGQKGYLPNPRPRATYAAMVSFLDDTVGRFMALLEELKLDRDTLVLFSSDNGTTYAGGVEPEFFDSVGELRGLKGSLYEGGIRVPTIARWPGRIAQGTTTDLPSACWDFLPTFVEVAGGEASAHIDGISLLPTLLGTGHQREHKYLYFEYPASGGQQAVIIGDLKGMRTNLKKGDLTIHLYNLAEDPGEQRDVAADHPEMVARMKRIMRKARVPSKEFPIPALDGI